ncbi:MAG: FAD-binding protein [Coriobacteriales bacterium]|nr:FAD-binding protein [Coriobacteriales bacterium]
MSKLNEVWIFADGPSAIATLAAGAHTLGDKVVGIYIGDGTDVDRFVGCGANEILQFSVPAGARADDMYHAVATYAKDAAPKLILLDKSAHSRMLAAVLSAELECAALTGVMEFVSVDDGIEVTQMVHGGSAIRTIKSTAPICVAICGNGVFAAPAAGDGAVATVVPVEAQAQSAHVSRIGLKPTETASVNLAAASKAVAIGRGVNTPEDVSMCEDLSHVIGAEMGCTRPVSEALGLMEKERYIGVSGVMFKPSVFVSIAASGQVQHMVGYNQSGTIFAINKDKSAPIFKQADYGIVGDFRTVVPKLMNLLES